MSDVPAGNGGQPTGPTMNVAAQYLKDLSFENPNTLQFMQAPPTTQPQFDLKINVNTKALGPNDHEVDLTIEAKALLDNKPMFVCEITYSGVFRITGVPQDQLGAVLMIECPRLLFPFARQIMADATQNGGYQPLLLPPIDFVSLYQQRAQQQAAGTA